MFTMLNVFNVKLFFLGDGKCVTDVFKQSKEPVQHTK